MAYVKPDKNSAGQSGRPRTKEPFNGQPSKGPGKKVRKAMQRLEKRLANGTFDNARHKPGSLRTH